MAEVCAEGLEDDGELIDWVPAAPFRAHLAHLMAVGDMRVEEVAALTGISLRGARHLLWGRCGRPVRRISSVTGRRLLRLTSFEARSVRTRSVAARGVSHQLRELVRSGIGLAEVARRSRVDETVLADLLARRLNACSPLLVAQVAAVHTELDVGEEVGYPLAS